MKTDDFTISGVTDLISRGFELDHVIKTLKTLDYSIIENLPYEEEGSSEQWKEITLAYPYSLQILMYNNSIAGYIRFVPLKQEYFEKAKRGQLLDSEITLEKLDDTRRSGRYKLYFVMLGIKKEFQHKGLLPVLLKGLEKELASLEKDGVYFDEVCADAYTPVGEAICKRLGMQKITKHVGRGAVYFKRFPLTFEGAGFMPADAF